MENKAKIVVIYDKSGLQSVESELVSNGYGVIPLEYNKEILEKVKQALPNVILIDTAALNSKGLELVKKLKGEDTTAGVPVMMITSGKERKGRQEALDTGVDDFILSPVNAIELKARIATLVKVNKYNTRVLDYEKNIETEVAKRTQELTLAFEKIKIASLDTVYRLSRAAEYRDDDVGTHIERMSHYATAIARAMALDEEYIENILWAAPMHDVGKIGIPDSVLRKPGKLDDEEWTIMKQHTTIGSEILKDSSTDFIKLAGNIALSHHEKWDGNGYPRGLKGEDIPLAGRIVSIADVFDALTTERPYKKAFPLEDAMSIIKEDTGSHFDPQVSEAFFSIENEIIQEYNFWRFMDSGSSDSEGDLSDLFGG